MDFRKGSGLASIKKPQQTIQLLVFLSQLVFHIAQCCLIYRNPKGIFEDDVQEFQSYDYIHGYELSEEDLLYHI